MTRFRNHLMIAVLFASLAVIGMIMNSRQVSAAPGSAPVNIVSPLPVPVSGTVAATQSGAWNVGITGTPTVNATVTFPANQDVTVTNTPSAPVPTRDVDHPARHSFQQSCGGAADSFGRAFCFIGPIPANTEFVIQTLSAFGSGTIPIGGVQVGTFNGTTNASIEFPVIEQTPNFWAATQAVTLYAGPTAVPSCTAQTSVGGFVGCTFVGYLVSLP